MECYNSPNLLTGRERNREGGERKGGRERMNRVSSSSYLISEYNN